MKARICNSLSLTIIGVTLAMIGLSASVRADTAADADVQHCLAQLAPHFSEQAELNLVDRRRSPHGTRMRVAVRQDANSAWFATCWVPRAAARDYPPVRVENLVAVTSPRQGAR